MAWLSRSENMATRTLAPVTSSRPDDWTWIQFVVDVVAQALAQPLDIDAAGPQNGYRIAVLGQGDQQVLQGRVLMPPLVGYGQRSMQRLLQVSRQHDRDYSRSRVHCKGC
jgi:hypothetical protein